MTGPIYDVASLWELVERRAQLTPDKRMLVDQADREITFGEFRHRCAVVAAGLHALGIGPGSPVSWQLPSRLETVVLSMALARLGAVQNPVIHIYREREVAFALRQTGAGHFFVPGDWRGFDYLAMARKIAGELPSPPQLHLALDELPEGDPRTLPPPPAAGAADEVRWVYYTSGTTSEPKGVRHTDRTLLTGGRGLAIALEMSEDDVGSIAFP
ncbi:MAG TPA: AMP-binding protein, partial [Acidimicrobiales bacterium]|nr:AMP-binding protein [Acidimicrobiales bacterium]